MKTVVLNVDNRPKRLCMKSPGVRDGALGFGILNVPLKKRLLKCPSTRIKGSSHTCGFLSPWAVRSADFEMTRLIFHRIFLYSVQLLWNNHSLFSLTLQGTFQRALKNPQTAMDPDLYHDREGTCILEEHYVQKNIRMVDTRGSFESGERLENKMLDIIFGR